MSNCRDLPPLSSGSSRKRMERAASILGPEVVSRILAFALYLLGANRKALVEFLGMPVDTIKSLVQRMLRDGLPAFEDRRGRMSTFLPPHAVAPETPCTLLVEEESLVVQLDESKQIKLPRHNTVQCRTVLLTLLDSRLLGVEEVAQAIGLSTGRIEKLRRKLIDGDVHALVDQRRGQQREYRVPPEVKAELILQYVLNLETRASTSSQQLSEDLAERCRIQVAQRTVRHHVAKLGLRRIRKSLPELLAEAKKNSER